MIAAVMLLLPLIAMQLTDEVVWDEAEVGANSHWRSAVASNRLQLSRAPAGRASSLSGTFLLEPCAASRV